MKRQIFCLLLKLSCCVGFSSAEPFRGVAIELTDHPLLDESLLNLQQIGVDTVAIDLLWHQPSSNSSLVDTTSIAATLASVRGPIDAAHSRGFNVFLRSKILVQSGERSARVTPDDAGAWFTSYGTILNSVAQFSADAGISMLSIGSSLNSLESPNFAPRWRELIGDVREEYTGRLTYSADFLFDAELGGGFEEVPWWNDLDVVGINATFPLTFDQNALLETLRDNVAAEADLMEDFLSDEQIAQPIIFTDVGYRSINGGAAFVTGEDRGGDRIDLDEQALAYDAVLTEMRSREWWGGAFWKGWQDDAHAGGAGDAGFTPQHKPAETVLATHYGGRPTFIIRPSLLESWEDGFNGWRLPDSPVSETGSLELVTVGATEGQTSLSLPASQSTNLDAARIWSLEGSEAYSLFQIASEHSEDFALEIDVTTNFSGPPDDSSTTLLVSFEDDSAQPVVVEATVTSSEDDSQATTVSIPFEEFGTLASDSLFYELQLGTNNSGNGELLLDNLRLRSTVIGDITNDALLNCNDIDALSDAVRHGFMDQQYDLTRDGFVDDADRMAWTQQVGSAIGDFDLNGVVEFADFLILTDNFGEPGNWCEGDANGNRQIEFADFLLVAGNFGRQGTLFSPVPEPGCDCTPALLVALVVIVFSRDCAHERH